MDAAKDGVRYFIMREHDYEVVKEGVLGNKSSNSFLSYNLYVEDKHMEGIYTVCLMPSESIFKNAVYANEESVDNSIFGRIFQEQDYSKLSFELSFTLERVFHGAFQTTDDLQQAQNSDSKRQ